MPLTIFPIKLAPINLALVGLQPTPKDSYAQSHPIALKCTKLAHEGDNMER